MYGLIKQNYHEKKKQQEHITNLMLITTLEAVVVFIGLILIFKGFNSSDLILFTRASLWVVFAVAVLAGAALWYYTFSMKKDWILHFAFAVFIAFIFAIMLFGNNTRFLNGIYSIYIASVVSFLYIIGVFVYCFKGIKK